MSAPDHGASPTGAGDELDPDEPRTPLWLPLLGLTLFLGALIYMLVARPEAAPVAPVAPAGSASAEPPAAAPN